MKVTISYQVDFVSNDLSNVGIYIDNKQYSEAIESVDIARQSLAKLDQSLLDYSNILTGYVKADADIKAGIAEQEFFNPEQTQEVPPENILDEKKEND
jgi:hypothetical protein